MSVMFRMLGCAVVAVALNAPGVGSLIDLESPPHAFLPDTPPEVSPSLWNQFKVSFNEHADEEFADRLHPFRLMTRTPDGGIRLLEESGDRTTDIVRRGISSSAGAGLGEAIMQVDLPIVSWLRRQSDFLAGIFEDSVDSVAEERMAPLDVTYQHTGRSWWNELADSDRVRYGIRPFRTSPYAFVSWSIHDGDQVHLLGHLRYRCRNFTEHSVELAFSVPMTRRVALEFGTAYHFKTEDYAGGQSIVAKLSKQFMTNGLLHVGLEMKENPVLVAGLSVAW